MKNSFKDYETNLAKWEELVLKGDLIYPDEHVLRFIFRNKFKSALDFVSFIKVLDNEITVNGANIDNISAIASIVPIFDFAIYEPPYF